MIDLHSHLLPGVDDGSRTLQQSVGVLREMAAQGVTDLCLTPHLLASRVEEGMPARYDAAFEELRRAAPEVPRLHRAVEIMLDRPLPLTLRALPALRIGGSRYVLVEFPRLVAAETALLALTHVASIGFIPLLAHPERYGCCTPEVAWRWREAGARMQVDANTLLTPQRRGERARDLVANGLADILAADNHGDGRTVMAARDALEAQGGEVQAQWLLVDNPRAILEDRATTPVEPLQLRLAWHARVRGLFASEDG